MKVDIKSFQSPMKTYEKKVQVGIWLRPSELKKLDRLCKRHKSRGEFIGTLINNV